MIWFLVRRTGLLIAALFVASMLIFVMLRMLHGDLATVIGGIDASPSQIAEIRRELGLDRPLWQQYIDWIGDVLHGDLGRSAVTNSTVTSQLGEKMTITVPLVLASTVVSIVVAVPLGVYAAARSRRADGLGVSVLAQLGVAVPQFLVGIALIALLAGKFGLPGQGFPRDGWSGDFWRSTQSLVLPTLTLAAAQTAVLVRFVRTATLDVLHQDYMRTARAKGLTRTQALVHHGLRNASIPVVSILGVQVASLLAGSVVIEQVFNLPGVGRMLLDDIGNRDFDKVQGTVLVISTIVIVIGFIVDVLHHLIDPRLRTTGR